MLETGCDRSKHFNIPTSLSLILALPFFSVVYPFSGGTCRNRWAAGRQVKTSQKPANESETMNPSVRDGAKLLVTPHKKIDTAQKKTAPEDGPDYALRPY